MIRGIAAAMLVDGSGNGGVGEDPEVVAGAVHQPSDGEGRRVFTPSVMDIQLDVPLGDRWMA